MLGVIVLLADSIAVVGHTTPGAHFEVGVHSDAVGAHSHCHFLFVELGDVAALGCRGVAEPKNVSL